MKVSILASGSKGNVTFIQSKKNKILIDAGKSASYITLKLSELNIQSQDIKYVILTHTHTDHICGLKGFIKKYQPYLCVSIDMITNIPWIKKYERLIIYENELIIKDIFIETIKTSHDAIDSRGFLITSDNSSLVYITDTGYINNKYFSKISNKNMYIIESNHDPEKLRNSKYPIWLQNRILSDYGHLSNDMTASYLTKLIGPNTKKIILAHLSEENNSEDIAITTLKQMLENHSIEFSNYCCAKQKENSEVVII